MNGDLLQSIGLLLVSVSSVFAGAATFILDRRVDRLEKRVRAQEDWARDCWKSQTELNAATSAWVEAMTEAGLAQLRGRPK